MIVPTHINGIREALDAAEKRLHAAQLEVNSARQLLTFATANGPQPVPQPFPDPLRDPLPGDVRVATGGCNCGNPGDPALEHGTFMCPPFNPPSGGPNGTRPMPEESAKETTGARERGQHRAPKGGAR